MTKQWLLALSLGSLAAMAWAQTVAAADDIPRRNAQINRLCKSIVQTRFNYANLAQAERESADRSHSVDIEACYRSNVITPTPTPAT
jgi:hypothetical protein